MSWSTVLLKDEAIWQQSMMIIKEFGQQIVDVVFGINFRFLINEMQYAFTVITNSNRNRNMCRELGAGGEVAQG